MKFKVGDRVTCIGDGSVGTVEHTREDYDWPFIIKHDSGERRLYRFTELELIQPETQEPNEQIMKFKVGDRVKWKNYNEVGVIEVVQDTIRLPYKVRFPSDNSMAWFKADDLELVQPEVSLPEAANKEPVVGEPIPGKFYRTRSGNKVLYVGRSMLSQYIYDTSEGIKRYATACTMGKDGYKSELDIVGEWTDEKVDLFSAAKELRLAQITYMKERGNDELGKKVAKAAEKLDAALASFENLGLRESK